MCTGSLISSTWVLTAAHCHGCHHIKYGNMSSPRSSRSRVLKFIPYPNYREINDAYYINDIALLLVNEVSIKTFGRLSAVEYRALYGYPVRYAGYGMMSLKLDSKESKLEEVRPAQIGEGLIVACYDKEETPAICMVPKCSLKEQVTKPGDSGSPVLVRNKIVGVLHGSGPHNEEIDTSLYTPVSIHLGWILSTMKYNMTR